MVLSEYNRIELAPDFTMLGLRIAIVCIVVDDMMILLKSLGLTLSMTTSGTQILSATAPSK